MKYIMKSTAEVCSIIFMYDHVTSVELYLGASSCPLTVHRKKKIFSLGIKIYFYSDKQSKSDSLDIKYKLHNLPVIYFV